MKVIDFLKKTRIIPRFLRKRHDGGKDSGVTGYWLIEWKPVFSIVLLKFNKGTRDAYHEHAFNALTFWVKGKVREEFFNGEDGLEWTPSFIPKLTKRGNCHRVNALETSWCISFRGPWKNKWKEVKGGKEVTLTHGREVVDERHN